MDEYVLWKRIEARLSKLPEEEKQRRQKHLALEYQAEKIAVLFGGEVMEKKYE